MGLDKDGYFSLRDILGYNCKVNIVLSDRGRGKSYGTKLFLMKQEGTFMCLYRNVSDVESAIGSWLDTLYENGYEQEEFEWVKGKGSCELLYHGSVKAYFRALTQVNHIKQEKFPDDLNWIWFDEFIPLAYKKLAGVPSEGDAIRTIMKTVDHDTAHSRESKGLKPLRVLMYANPFTWDNPILSYFRVLPQGYGIWRVGPDIVCEMLEPVESSREGKMTMDQFLGEEINKNQAWADQKSFVVDKWPSGVEAVWSVRYGTNYYWLCGMKGVPYLYVKRAERHSKTARCVIGTLDGKREKEDALDNVRRDQLKTLTTRGFLKYADMNVKFDWVRDVTNTCY
jgi:hypothetical protein